jgi:hypothetical protein
MNKRRNFKQKSVYLLNVQENRCLAPLTEAAENIKVQNPAAKIETTWK